MIRATQSSTDYKKRMEPKAMLEALKLCYRKHHLGDESIGWNELSTIMYDTLCREMGDEGFVNWLEEVKDERE